MSFAESLGGLVNLPQWFLWRLEWNGAEGKYDKTPCYPDGSHYHMAAAESKNWMTFAEASARQEALCAALPNKVLWYALGFWMTDDCGYFFFDIDKCVNEQGLLPHAQQFVDYFKGAFFEYSSSGKGVHIIGQYPQDEPPHRSRDMHRMHMEFYTQDRGIAFGLSGWATGSADWQGDAQVKWLIENYFPPLPKIELVGRRDDWRGPEDDDVLIQRMLNRRETAEQVVGTKVSLRQLWEGNAEKNSDNDMALASHLAFWTGCDPARMERLMRRSGMAREKWNEHRTYLVDLTIGRAIATCSAVYVEPARSTRAADEMYGRPAEHVGAPHVAGPESYSHVDAGDGGGLEPASGTNVVRSGVGVVSASQFAEIEAFLDRVAECDTLLTMHNEIIPAIIEARFPPALGERLVGAINRRLQFWDSKIPVPKLRALLFPRSVQGGTMGNAPEWAMRHCYVQALDAFWDVERGVKKTIQGYNAEYNRCMPLKDNGSPENAAEWSLNRWGVRTVDAVAYRPDEAVYFTWAGTEFVNTYNPASVPQAQPIDAEGYAAIETMQTLLWNMCGKRADVFNALMSWLACNVQQPGKKIIWSPIIKGVNGDGKSFIANMLDSVMGSRNVSITGPNTLTNSGGFTDWAVRAAVNVIEEIYLTGEKRYALANAMKEYITNPKVNINPKGRQTLDVRNITNHIALTNHNNAIPLDKTDRRWFVIYTPWESLAAMDAYCGETMRERFGTLRRAIETLGPQFRTWLLGWPVDMSVVEDIARETPEKKRMRASGREEIDVIAEGIIEGGCYGVTHQALSSGALSSMLAHRAAIDHFEIPRGQGVTHMLMRLGYSQMESVLWWDGKTHRIWVRDGFNGDAAEITRLLDSTKR